MQNKTKLTTIHLHVHCYATFHEDCKKVNYQHTNNVVMMLLLDEDGSNDIYNNR